jgi:hypothetical protein
MRLNAPDLTVLPIPCRLFGPWIRVAIGFRISLIEIKGRKTDTDSDSDSDIDQFGSNRGCAVAAELEKP